MGMGIRGAAHLHEFHYGLVALHLHVRGSAHREFKSRLLLGGRERRRNPEQGQEQELIRPKQRLDGETAFSDTAPVAPQPPGAPTPCRGTAAGAAARSLRPPPWLKGHPSPGFHKA